MLTDKAFAAKFKYTFTTSLCILATALALILSACSPIPLSASPTPTPSNSQQSGNFPIAALQGYQVSLFASSTSSYSHPDAVDWDGNHIFIDYLNNTATDGTDHGTSTIVEYTIDGKVVKTFSVPGHSDGMRVDPSTHLLWAVSNEDANPTMVTIDPGSGSVTPYTFPPAPHGGGYDDLYFLNGMTFITASNPTLNNNGVNVFPAIDKITLSGGQAVLTPVLMGNSTAVDTTSNTTITLNETDPDSLSADTNGDLIMVNAGDADIVYLHNPGTAQQKVTYTQVGASIDDIVWVTSPQGRLLVVDRATGKTYWIRTPFNVGTVYTETYYNTGVTSVVGQLDPGTGNISPIAIGFTDPTGLFFVPLR